MLLCPWDSPGKNTGVGCHALLQGIFPTQGSNLRLLWLLHCRQILKKKKKLEVVIVWLSGVKVEKMIPEFLAGISLQMGVTFTFLWNFKSKISNSRLDVLVYCSGVWASGKNQWLDGPAKETEKGCQYRWEEKQGYKKLRSPGEYRASRRKEWPKVSGAANKL